MASDLRNSCFLVNPLGNHIKIISDILWGKQKDLLGDRHLLSERSTDVISCPSENLESVEGAASPASSTIISLASVGSLSFLS